MTLGKLKDQPRRWIRLWVNPPREFEYDSLECRELALCQCGIDWAPFVSIERVAPPTGGSEPDLRDLRRDDLGECMGERLGMTRKIIVAREMETNPAQAGVVSQSDRICCREVSDHHGVLKCAWTYCSVRF
jgi:hypothetical protein